METGPSKATPDNWQKARSLYESRVSHAIIVKEAHVTLAALRKRILREGWRVARTEAKEIAEGQNLQQKSEQLRGLVLDECLKDAHIVSQHEPRNMGQSIRRQELLTKITNNGEKAGGWSGAVTTMTISIENLNSCRLAEPIGTADGSGPRPTAPGQVFIAFDANGKSYECDHHEFLSALQDRVEAAEGQLTQ
jgi:hypothetical protein